jgi:hypothetical protein
MPKALASTSITAVALVRTAVEEGGVAAGLAGRGSSGEEDE